MRRISLVALMVAVPLLSCEGLVRVSGNPVAVILAPATGDEVVAGEPLQLIGRVESWDGEDIEFMHVKWSSDRDGELFDGPVDNEDGDTQLTIDWLQPGGHRIELEARQIDDGLGVAFVDITVVEAVDPPNEPPACAITAPDDGDVLVAGATLLLTGTAADPDDTPEALAAEWSSSLEGELGDVPVEGDGQVSHLVELDGGDHTLTLRVEDADGAACTADVDVLVCSSPSADIVLPTGSTSINEGDPLLVQGEVGDDVDAPDDLEVTWTSSVAGLLTTSDPTAGGDVLEELTGLPAGPQLVTLEVIDTCGLVASDSVTVTVNAVPTVPGVVISPSEPLTDDSLTAVVTSPSTDPDGDAPTLLYGWTADFVPQPYSGPTVPSAATTKNEVWTVTITATDGEATSDGGTATVTIANSIPQLSGVTLGPPNADVATILSCTPSGLDDDDPDDDADPVYSWTVDGTPYSLDQSTLAAPWFGVGDVVTCTVTPDDGQDTGAPMTSNAVVIGGGNGFPSAPGIAITPASPSDADALVCSVTVPSVDPDGDAVTYSWSWSVGGSPAGYSTDTVPAVATSLGEAWTCTVTPYDAIGPGTPSSATVTIGGSCPTEVCDGVDNDCDGFVDEGFDGDGDSWTTCAGDCDDSDPAIHPDAVEICNGVDDDCDGVGDSGADADGDGFSACDDCDDNDDQIFPGSTAVIDGVDTDCDGVATWNVELTITCDDAYTVWVDSTLSWVGADSGFNSWHGAETYTVPLDSGTHVFCVEGVNTGGVKALMAEIALSDGSTWPTDASWVGLYSEPAGWCEPTFDDSGWFNSSELGGWGTSPWGQSPTALEFSGAQWIWGGSTQNTWWFRKVFTLP